MEKASYEHTLSHDGRLLLFGAHNRRQWFHLSSSGGQLRGLGDEQCSNADRERGGGSTDDHDTPCKPDGDRRTDRELHRTEERRVGEERTAPEEWCQQERRDKSA